MTVEMWALVFFGVLAILLLLKVRIGTAILMTSVLGSVLLYGFGPGITMAVTAAFSSVATFTLTAVPLFILMGELIFRTGLANEALGALDHVLFRLRGRLAYLTVLAGGLLGVLSGSAVASTGILGGSLLPEMGRRGYQPQLAAGAVLGAGGLAMVLPPSALVIVLGSTAGISVGPLLMAGLIPGALMLLGYLVVVTVQVYIGKKDRGGEEVNEGSVSLTESKLLTKHLAAISVVVVAGVTLWTILAGIATPSEAAGVGLLLTVVVALAFRRLSVKACIEALKHTVLTTGMIFFLIIAAAVYARIMSGTGIIRELTSLLLGVAGSEIVLMLIMLAIVVVLGCFLEGAALVLLTMPLFMPIVQSMGMDPIWFGILVVIAVQIGTVTPPLGLSLFVVKAFLPQKTSLFTVYRAAVPFLLSDLAVILLVLLVPTLATFLPSIM